jgi:hypothetical protein
MKDPAEAAIAEATNVMKKIEPDAQKYAPTEYAALHEQVAVMKAAFDKQDYQTVLNTVRKLTPAVRMLAETVANRQRDARHALKQDWKALSGDTPQALAAVEARIAELGKTHKLPKGVAKDALAGAGTLVGAAKQDWSDAEAAQQGGNVEDAVAKGKAAQAKLAELMAALAMPHPAAATAAATK